MHQYQFLYHKSTEVQNFTFFVGILVIELKRGETTIN